MNISRFMPSSTPTRRWMSACRICGWRSGFLNMRWGRRKISPFVCVSTPTNILITLHRRSRKPCLPTSKSGSTPFVRRVIWAAPHIKKARLAVCFMIFSAGILLRLMSLFRLPSLVRCSTTPGHTWKRKSTSRGLLARNRVISLPTEHRRRTKLWVCTPRRPAVRC